QTLVDLGISVPADGPVRPVPPSPRPAVQKPAAQVEIEGATEEYEAMQLGGDGQYAEEQYAEGEGQYAEGEEQYAEGEVGEEQYAEGEEPAEGEEDGHAG